LFPNGEPPPLADHGRLIRQAELWQRLAVSPATGFRLASAGKIGPRPIRVGPGSVRYHLAEVLTWLERRLPDGSLHDRRTWPPVWAALQKGRGSP
jgi:predicted DNA-binding transcriptional regulator AlpA